MKKKPIIALIYDFDKTLCTKDMQEYGFIPSLHMNSRDFWNEVRKLTDQEGMDEILAYMYYMVAMAKEKHIPIQYETFFELGKGIEYFSGVGEWFPRISAYGKQIGVDIEHYIVSSGIKEIIEGSSISPYFKKIYACEFMYDHEGNIAWPKFAVNYTAKTQFLFRINKGVLDITSESTKQLNQYTPDIDRRVPFGNMIYIGDGLTDVPCMKLVSANGGQSIAVFGEKGDQFANELLSANRVNFIAKADYSKNSQIEIIVKSILNKILATHNLDFLKSEKK